MDVTPHELRTIELREAWRGYRQDDVDQLLDRVAVTIERLQATVEDLGERLRKADEEVGMGREADEMLRRTLLLAQRTADAAVAEAQERARRVIAESEAQARSIVTSAEEEARRLAVTERERLEEQLRELARRRDLLAADVDALERVAADHRARLLDFMEAEMAAVAARPLPVAPVRPRLHEVDLPGPEQAAGAPAGPEKAWGDAEAPLPTIDLRDEQAGAEPAPILENPAHDDLAQDDLAQDDLAHDDLAQDDPDGEGPPEDIAAPPAGEPDDVAVEDEARPEADILPRHAHVGARLDPADVERFERGPGASLEDDAFFEELRQAVTDETPLGPRDDDVPVVAELVDAQTPLFDQDAPEGSGRLRSVFRRRG